MGRIQVYLDRQLGKVGNVGSRVVQKEKEKIIIKGRSEVMGHKGVRNTEWEKGRNITWGHTQGWI